MKKILLILLVLSFSLMLFSCGECEEHTDSNGDGICDECDERIDNNGEENPPEEPSDENPDEIELPEIKF
jgi:hypothetical protein